MELRDGLVVLAVLLLASAGGAEPPSTPASSRLGRPVLQVPRTEEGQTAPAGTGGQPGGSEEKGSKRLGRPVMVVPSPHVGGAARRAVPAHSASEQRRQPGGGATTAGHQP